MIRKKELVIVGEWMAPLVFKFEEDHFTKLKTDLDGYWDGGKRVAVADVNADGRR